MSNELGSVERGLIEFDETYKEAARIERTKIKDNLLIKATRLLEEALSDARSGDLLNAQVKRMLSEQTLNLARQS